MQSILITGSNGFIGSHLSKYFSEKNYRIYGVSKYPLEKLNLCSFKENIICDLLGEEVKDLLKKIQPDYIFHCAGNSSIKNSIKNPLNDFQNNSYLTYEFLNLIRQFTPSSKFYFFSSAAVYGNPQTLPIKENHNLNPISPYGFHKLLSEHMCIEFSKLYSLNTVILRIFSAYGAGLRRQIFYDLMNKFVNDKEIILKGTGKESRDFINVFDICKAIELIMAAKSNEFEIYNIANGEEITIKNIASLFSSYLDSNKAIKFDNKNTFGMPLNWKADITKLKKIGFKKNIQFHLGIKDYISWFNNDILME